MANMIVNPTDRLVLTDTKLKEVIADIVDQITAEDYVITTSNINVDCGTFTD